MASNHENRVLLENYYLPEDLESLNNVTLADVYFGREKSILRERAETKKQTIQKRHLQRQNKCMIKLGKRPEPPLIQTLLCSTLFDDGQYISADQSAVGTVKAITTRNNDRAL